MTEHEYEAISDIDHDDDGDAISRANIKADEGKCK